MVRVVLRDGEEFSVETPSMLGSEIGGDLAGRSVLGRNDSDEHNQYIHTDLLFMRVDLGDARKSHCKITLQKILQKTLKKTFCKREGHEL